MRKLLDDVTVLDFSQSVAGPHAGVLLADFGANVITIEPPGGSQQRDLMQGSFRPNIMRNKRSLTVDLKSDEADEIIAELVESADILIHNYRPEVVQRLDIDYESVKAINEQVIYCSLTAYGETGPYKDRPGTDPLAQAMSGLMWNTGEPDRKPSRIGASLIDVATGVYTAYAAMAALWERKERGSGRKIETSLFDTAAAFMSNWYTYYSRTGEQPQRQGHAWEGYAPVGVHETADAPVYLSVLYDHLWERFCKALGREEWLDDPRFEEETDRIENREALTEEIEEEFSTYSREEVMELLLDAGIPASEVQTIAEAATDEHLRQRGTITSITDVDETEVLTSTAPFKLSDGEPSIDRNPPRPGEHNREVLSEMGFSDEEIERLRDEEVIRSE